MKNKIKCLLVNPYQLPKEIEINNDLETLQQYVGGYIETIQYNDVIIICNDEGKLNYMQPNRAIGSDIIFGPFLVVGDDFENADFKSLTERQMLENKIRFDKYSIRKTNDKINQILGKTVNDIIQIKKEEYNCER